MRQTIFIEKNKHSAPIKERLKLWFNVSVLGYKITDFQVSGVREDLGDDRFDWNKLVGRGRMIPKIKGRIMSGHHWRSSRIGWRWNEKRNEREYCHYQYIQGERLVKRITKGDALDIISTYNRVNLFPYHGGNRKATRRITFMFELEK